MKTIWIFTYHTGDDILSDYFIADYNLSHAKAIEKARKYLKDQYEYEGVDIKETYPVMESIIKELKGEYEV